MHVMLDQEEWTASSSATLGDVLAEMSDKAHARARLITSLTIDRRTITDRDLDAAFLAEPAARFAEVQAVSCTVADMQQGVEDTLRRYAGELHLEALMLVASLRRGEHVVARVDAWCGKLADFLECADSAKGRQAEVAVLTPFVQALLQARVDRDVIRLADLLEYEVAPRLGF